MNAIAMGVSAVEIIVELIGLSVDPSASGATKQKPKCDLCAGGKDESMGIENAYGFPKRRMMSTAARSVFCSA